MKIREIKSRDMQILEMEASGLYLTVEQQPYGSDADVVFRIAISNETNEFLGERLIGREVKDTGRTIGFFQNLGASGVYKPQECPFYFPVNVAKIIKTRRDGTVYVQGSTWAEIIFEMSKTSKLTPSFVASLDIDLPTDVETPKKRSRKTKKSGQNVQSQTNNN